MSEFFLTVLVGVVAGGIDILPMIKMRLDKHAIASAFVFYFIIPFIIFNTDLLSMPWWLKGGVITFALSIPVLIIVSKSDKKSVLPIAITSVVLGTLIGVMGYFFVK